jgi:hypothetical protein
MVDEKLEPTVTKVMVKGEADHLDSAFHLGYNDFELVNDEGGGYQSPVYAREMFLPVPK